MQAGDVVSTYADVSDFGYKPDTSLEVGIEKFVKWYKNFYIDKAILITGGAGYIGSHTLANANYDFIVYDKLIVRIT